MIHRRGAQAGSYKGYPPIKVHPPGFKELMRIISGLTKPNRILDLGRGVSGGGRVGATITLNPKPIIIPYHREVLCLDGSNLAYIGPQMFLVLVAGLAIGLSLLRVDPFLSIGRV